MDYRDYLNVAMNQSAIDLHCAPEDFTAPGNRVVVSEPDPRARKYLVLPFTCSIVTYGMGAVASVRADLREAVQGYLDSCAPGHLFDMPDLNRLADALSSFGLRARYMAEYFLPRAARMPAPECPYPLRLLTPPDFRNLYKPEWSNALSSARPQLDVLAVGAYDGDRLVGLAGASADCDSMWQIGIDVLPGYRRQGIASALTARLAAEVFARGRLPFYCAAWCNLPSVRNALCAGFRPVWVEMAYKPA